MDYGLEWTSQTPLAFAPLQTLAWLIDAMLRDLNALNSSLSFKQNVTDACSSLAQTGGLFENLSQEISLKFNTFLWSNAFVNAPNQPSELTRQAGPNLLNGALGSLLSFFPSLSFELMIHAIWTTHNLKT